VVPDGKGCVSSTMLSIFQIIAKWDSRRKTWPTVRCRVAMQGIIMEATGEPSFRGGEEVNSKVVFVLSTVSYSTV
jgi:hypothetical protein